MLNERAIQSASIKYILFKSLYFEKNTIIVNASAFWQRNARDAITAIDVI